MNRVLVAPREITDLVNRASRVAGCGASLAAEVAADVTAAEIGSGDGVAAFLGLLDTRAHELRDLAARAAVDPSVPEVLRFRLASDDERSAQHDRAALTNGVAVDASAWNRLEAVAADFLLAERVIDASA